MATGRTPQVVNFKCINELLTPETEDTSLREHCVPFLPNNALKALVSRDRVEATLTKRFGFKGETKSIMANHVMKKAKKVFLVLLFTGMEKEHWETLQETAFKFADTCLPIKGKTAGPQDDKWAGSLVLDDRERKTFLADQWIFLAPTFRKADFTREFDRDRILPFVPIENAIPYTGHFGTVYHLGLRLDHTEESPMSPTRDGVPKECIEVALKATTVQRSKTTGTNVEKFYDKETHTLKLMRGFNHPHLIKAIAAYKKGHYRCFVFPWASGGSLKSLLEQGSHKLDKHMVTWAFNQMLGICEGIEKLHAENVRHGDIKPLNILYFPENPNSGFAWGSLVVADVGLAKVHEEYTKERDPGTTTRHGTNMYQPPEMASFLPAKTTMSRKYDIWSLGCVFLECVVWLRHGPEGHKRLHDKFNASRVWRFWVLDSNGQWKLHKAVRSQIEELKRKFGNESALGRLVNLISKKLLVSEVHRTDAKNLVRDLKSIRSECRVGSLSDLAPDMEILANQRSGPLPQPEGDQDLDSPSNQPRTSKLDSQWRTIPENRWARTLITRLEWATLKPQARLTELCAACRSIDFLSLHLSLGRGLKDLDRGAGSCPMCRFLCSCLSKYFLNRDEIVALSTNIEKHAFVLSQDAAPAISIYLDPESPDCSPSQAQLGLPLLPRPGSPQQLTILNEWISICNKYHHCISRQFDKPKSDTLPTRLIDVGTSDTPILRLIETTDNSAIGHFVALSHRWGVLNDDERVCTYASNINTFKRGIPFYALPRTFRDAVIVTRALGVQYLWIDSLCIIQGDNKDWEAEAGKMEDVFSSAYFTIAATSSKSSLDGFILNQTQRAAIGIHTSQGILYLAEAVDNFEADVERAVLNTRGWVLQERALSRRIIHFSATQVYWECGEGVCCETLAALGNRKSQFLSDPEFPTYGLDYYKDERIQLVQYLYRVYSGLSLTHKSDRSKAILGMQNRLGQTFKSTAKYGVISAYFERTILWQADVPASLLQIDYKQGHTVPSWSWMSVMGRIRYMDIPFNEVTWTGDLENPFKPGFDETEWNGQLIAKAKRLSIDDSEFEQRCKIDLSLYKFEPSSWMCVVVGESKAANEDGDKNQYVLLIRKRSSVVTPPVYERVGVGILLQTQVGLGTIEVHIV